MPAWLRRIYRAVVVARAPHDIPAPEDPTPAGMILEANEGYGWTARYPWDDSVVWANERELAIYGCAERAREEDPPPKWLVCGRDAPVEEL